MIISISKNQDHTLKSPIWSKPAVDCPLSNAGHCKIVTLMSHMLSRSSSHTLAVLLFRALCGISPGSLRWLSFCVYGFCSRCVSLWPQTCAVKVVDLRVGARICVSWTLALELCVKRGTRMTAGSERLAEAFSSSSELSSVALLLFPSPPAQSSKSGNLRLPTRRKEGRRGD